MSIASAEPGVLLTVSYEGSRFAGFAAQPKCRTVYGVLFDAARALDPSISRLRGASRTDAGVHARGQAVAFDPARHIPCRGWVLGMNAHLPSDLAVRGARCVPRGFEPRAFSRGKRYRYRIMRDALRDPLLESRVWRLGQQFDVASAREEADVLVGTHDFAAFRSSADPRVDTTRTVHAIHISEGAEGDARLIDIEVDGTGFLHNMVRIIVGTLADVARGRLRHGATARALVSRSRRDLGMTAPPYGLYLDEVRLALEPPAPGDAWP